MSEIIVVRDEETVVVLSTETETVEVNTPGVPGPQGPQGEQGPEGPEGPQGPPGVGGSTALVDLTDVTGEPPATGEAPVWDGDSFELTDVATQAELDAHAADTTSVHGIADTSALETASGAQAKVDAHVNDATDAHDASAISYVGGTGMSATDVEAAIDELANEKADTASAVMDGDAAGGVLSGTYPNPGFASDMATQAELDAHINDSSDAHDASAISILDAAGDFTATDVEGALAELQSDAEADAQALADHLADTSDAHDASAISILDAAGDFTATDVEGALAELQADAEADAQALADHLADASDAHDASAISTVPAGNLAASDVQAALNELDSEKAAAASAVMDGDAAGGVLAGTYPNPSFASDMATQAELDAHINDSSDAHDASAVSIADAGGYFTGTDVEAALQELGASPGGGSGTDFSRDIAQTGHGLAVGDVVRFDGADYVKAQANSAANAEVVGIVSEVADTDNFTLLFGGRITGLSGLTAGNVYYLDDDTAGLLTTTEPADLGDISKPLLLADSTTSGYFFNFRGAENVAPGGASALVDLTDVTGGPPGTGEAPVWDGDSFEYTDVATQAELDAHTGDTSDAHDAAAISVADSGGYFVATDVEAALAELGLLHADPVAAVFGTPDIAYEFGTSSLSGLTAVGTPTAEAAHTTHPGHYYVADDTSTVDLCGRYHSGLTVPFTGVTKVTDANVYLDGNHVGIYVGPASLGALDMLSIGDSNTTIHVDNITSPTGSIGNAFGKYTNLTGAFPIYLCIVANSSTDVDYWISWNGYVWKKVVDGRNPGNTGTLASVGIGFRYNNGTSGTGGAVFDFLRIWNSAKTPLGV